MNEPIVSVRDLSIRYRTRETVTYATENVSFDLRHGVLEDHGDAPPSQRAEFVFGECQGVSQ